MAMKITVFYVFLCKDVMMGVCFLTLTLDTTDDWYSYDLYIKTCFFFSFMQKEPV